jgi:DnaK suppressor protein
MTTPTPHLTTGQRALLRAELELRKRALDQQLALHQEGRSRAEHAHDVLERDFDDAPQRAMDREVDMALSDLETQELGQVSRALLRLDEPDFGTCGDCAQEIPFDRLKAEPFAMRCVACETRHERDGQRKT